MLNFGSLQALSVLVDLGELRRAKKLAALILASAEVSELWTIARCAAILDGSTKLAIGRARLDKFARELDDEHRAALIGFCRDHTGNRPRRTLTDPAHPLFGLSVDHDTRPGYDHNDAQPAGLAVYPTAWDARQARTMDQLTRQLRTAKNQLPAHMRTEMRAIKTTEPARRRPPKPRTQQKADRKADDYMRTRLGIDDRSAPPNVRRTIFDIDDDAPATNRDVPDAYTLDYDKAARTPLRVTPCVWCFIERRRQDAPRNRHDDGLCGDCRDQQRPALPTPTSTPRTARPTRTVAYLNPAARAHATRAAASTAPCAAVAAHLPRAAALVWIRAHYALANDAERATIAEWVAAWLATDQPQPPTTPAPAAPIQPTPALAAA
jgi:hypothetical protein